MISTHIDGNTAGSRYRDGFDFGMAFDLGGASPLKSRHTTDYSLMTPPIIDASRASRRIRWQIDVSELLKSIACVRCHARRVLATS